MEWTDAIAHFTVLHTARGYAPRTIGNRLELVARMRRLVDKPLDEVTRLDLTRILARGISPASMQRERADMQAFFRCLHADGVLSVDPSVALEKIQNVPKGRPRPYTIAQIERLLGSGAYHRTRVMIILGYLHGLRAHEIAKIHADDFDLEQMQLRVNGKGGRHRVVPIHASLAAEIPTMPAEGYWFPARGGRGGFIHWRSVSDLMTKAKQRAGITDPRLTGHSLRHSFGTQLVWSGADLRTAQELLGHASLATTQIYTEISPDKLTAAVSALPVPLIPSHSGRTRHAA